MAIDFPATRWSLIARLPDQPQQASTLIGLYVDAIGAYLQMRLTGERPEQIEEIVQDVLTDLLAKPEALAKAKPGSGSRFRYYLMHLAWQAGLNALRYHRRRVHGSLDASPSDDGQGRIEQLPDGMPAPDQVATMDRAWALSVVQQALEDVERACTHGQLDSDAVTVLRANLLDGLSLRDIAARSGLSLATCSRRLASARHFLQSAMIERLRLAGEVGPQDDLAVAGERLLAALATS
jgi:RNA polymerase sigma factor (sigma-70 family)